MFRFVWLASCLFLMISAAAQSPMFDICPLKVGEEIPSVTVLDESRSKLDLKEWSAEESTVLIFYRGAWCGYCTKHLAELNEVKADIEKLGFQIAGITIDQVEKLDESRTKIENEIQVFSDAKSDAISAFGLDWKVGDELFDKYKNSYKLDLEEWSGQNHHKLPVPAVYVIQDGMVAFQYVNPNYNTRLKPSTLMAVLTSLVEE